MALRVLKFGGTSLATPDRLKRVVALIRRALGDGPVVVVVSAFGGVTNALLDALREPATELAQTRLEEIYARHHRAADALGVLDDVQGALNDRRNELTALLKRQRAPEQLTPAERDRVLASGEAWSATILSAALRRAQIPARVQPAEALILTDASFGAAQVDLATTTLNLRSLGPRFFRDAVIVVPGFTGATADGETTTLGRNASDYTAAVVAAALHANLDIYTDVAGVFSADPKRVPAARVLPALSFADAGALARAGANVIHGETLAPLKDSGLTVRVLDSFQPEAPGTRLDQHPIDAPDGAAIALKLDADSARLSVLARAVAATLPVRIDAALRAHGIAVATIERDGVLVAARLARHHADRALDALHQAIVLGLKRINLAVIGATGRVGRALIKRLEWVALNAADEQGLELKLVAVANSKRGLIDITGISGSELDVRLASPSAARPADFWAQLSTLELGHLIVVDVTASAEVAERYAPLLKRGVAIVAANKLAPAGDAARFASLREFARSGGGGFWFETTVGAGLPVLKTLSELRTTGETLTQLDAVLSGTLNYVCDALNRGLKFSDAVLKAVDLGLTEPDPRIDLSGLDVARKLVILLRAAGKAITLEQIHVEPLLAALPDETLLDTLSRGADALEARAHAAIQNGQRLVYRARLFDGRAQVSLSAVDATDPIGHLQGPENLIRVWTPSYQAAPLTIRGPGAGVDVTAAGVLADVLSAASSVGNFDRSALRRAA